MSSLCRPGSRPISRLPRSLSRAAPRPALGRLKRGTWERGRNSCAKCCGVVNIHSALSCPHSRAVACEQRGYRPLCSSPFPHTPCSDATLSKAETRTALGGNHSDKGVSQTAVLADRRGRRRSGQLDVLRAKDFECLNRSSICQMSYACWLYYSLLLDRFQS